MHLYVYDCVIHWDVHVGYSGSRCCAHNFGTAGCRNNGPSEHCHGTLFTPRSLEVSDRRRVTKRDKRGRNSGREYIAEENLHLQTEQRLGMLMTCGSIKYSLS